MSLFAKIKSFSAKILPKSSIFALRRVKLTLLDGYSYKSYSQDGADNILRNYFLKVNDGFYIDIGAHHPKRFSMTQIFYKKGWSGINIDAMPGSMKEFYRKRVRDINLEIAIAKEEGESTFYVSNEPALNSLDQSHKTIEIANSKKHSQVFQIVEEIKVKTRRLENVLEDFLPLGRQISFLSVDVEGLDLAVLQSNNWDKFRPRCIVVECLDKTLDKVVHDPLYMYLIQQDYCLIAKTLDNLIFEDIRFKNMSKEEV